MSKRKKNAGAASCTKVYTTEMIDDMISELAEAEATLNLLAEWFGPESERDDYEGYRVAQMLSRLVSGVNVLLIDGAVKGAKEVRHG